MVVIVVSQYMLSHTLVFPILKFCCIYIHDHQKAEIYSGFFSLEFDSWKAGIFLERANDEDLVGTVCNFLQRL
jgi:hypothetical protein